MPDFPTDFPVAPRRNPSWGDLLTAHLQAGTGALRPERLDERRRRAEQRHARRRLWHRTNVDAHTDPMNRAAAAGDYFRAVLAQMDPADAARIVAEHVDDVLRLIDQMEAELNDERDDGRNR